MKQYHYLSPERSSQEPVSEDRLYALLAAGVVTSDTLVWCKGMSMWQALSTVLPPAPSSPSPSSIQRALISRAAQQPSPHGEPRHTWTPRRARLSCWEYFVQCITKKYATFSGRATLEEFWSASLFICLFDLACILSITLTAGIAGRTDSSVSTGLLLLSIVFVAGILASCIPAWAVCVRRLHDTNRSGWNMLLHFIPLVGDIVLLVFFLQDSRRGTNQYGPSEKHPDARLSCWEYFVQCFTKKYATFSGRATRKEFWGASLFIWLFYCAYILLSITLTAGIAEKTNSIIYLSNVSTVLLLLIIIFVVGTLAICIPAWAVCIRRLHDTNRSGWNILLQLIPLVGLIVLLVFFLQDSHRGTNLYGPSEKHPN